MLNAKRLQPERFMLDAGEAIESTVQPDNIRLWCAEGGLLFTINQKVISIQAGDTLDIPANTYYEARTGLGGCVWYQQAIPS